MVKEGKNRDIPLVAYSFRSASIGSMFDAIHAGYSPEATQTTTPMTMP